MNTIRSTLVLSLLALLVLVPATPAHTAPQLNATVGIEEMPIPPFLSEGCSFPKEIKIIGASKYRTFLVAARRVMTLMIDWARCKQLLPFSISLVWLSPTTVGGNQPIRRIALGMAIALPVSQAPSDVGLRTRI